MLEDGKRIANQTWTAKEVDIINQMFLLTAKPCIYLINLSEKDYIRKKNKYLLKIKEWVDTNSPGDLIVPLSVSLEEKLANMESDEESTVKKLVLNLLYQNHCCHETKIRFDFIFHWWSR